MTIVAPMRNKFKTMIKKHNKNLHLKKYLEIKEEI